MIVEGLGENNSGEPTAEIRLEEPRYGQ